MMPPGTRALRRGPLSVLWRPRAALVCGALLLACLMLGLMLLGTGTLRLSRGR